MIADKKEVIAKKKIISAVREDLKDILKLRYLAYQSEAACLVPIRSHRLSRR